MRFRPPYDCPFGSSGVVELSEQAVGRRSRATVIDFHGADPRQMCLKVTGTSLMEFARVYQMQGEHVIR